MQKSILYTFAVVTGCFILCCCNGKNSSTPSANTVFGLDSVVIERTIRELVPNDTTIDYTVHVKYYTLKNASAALSDSVNQVTYNWIAGFFMGAPNTQFPLDSLISRSFHSFLEEVDDAPPGCVACRLRSVAIAPDSLYKNEQTITLTYNWSEYSGGAHGMYGKMCFVFNKETGHLLTYNDLVKNEKKLVKYAEKRFRADNGLMPTSSLEDDWFFPDGKFYLNSNFAFSADGLTFYYTPYEIAPFAIGMITLFLPSNDIKNYVNYMD